ncbi:hypothetical protein ACVS9P_08255 [Caproicibacterium sp. NSD3]
MILTVNEDANQFKTLSEFKSCMSRGGDVKFEWKGIDYTLSSVWPNDKMKFSIGPCTRVEKGCTVYDTVDELLNTKWVVTSCGILLRRQKLLTGHYNKKAVQTHSFAFGKELSRFQNLD